jgi:Uma2 family endonuclease
MVAVTGPEAWPARGEPFTVVELDRMPDDGRRYELLDGELLVSARPTTIHQLVAFRLATTLARGCPPSLCVVPEPAVQLSRKTEFDPDIVVVPLAQVGDAKFTQPPLLAVEVRSPSTALVDLNRKKAAYAAFGVQSYWIVDPDLKTPALTAFELADGSYATAAYVRASQPFTATRPFPVEVVPVSLVEGIRPGSA